MEHKLCIKGEMIRRWRFGNEEDACNWLFEHAESKPNLKYGSQTWIFSAYDGGNVYRQRTWDFRGQYVEWDFKTQLEVMIFAWSWEKNATDWIKVKERQ
jgi:hypothetical protein